MIWTFSYQNKHLDILERVGDDSCSLGGGDRMTWISVATIQYPYLINVEEKKLQVISKSKRKYTSWRLCSYNFYKSTYARKPTYYTI